MIFSYKLHYHHTEFDKDFTSVLRYTRVFFIIQLIQLPTEGYIEIYNTNLEEQLFFNIEPLL